MFSWCTCAITHCDSASQAPTLVVRKIFRIPLTLSQSKSLQSWCVFMAIVGGGGEGIHGSDWPEKRNLTVDILPCRIDTNKWTQDSESLAKTIFRTKIFKYTVGFNFGPVALCDMPSDLFSRVSVFRRVCNRLRGHNKSSSDRAESLYVTCESILNLTDVLQPPLSFSSDGRGHPFPWFTVQVMMEPGRSISFQLDLKKSSERADNGALLGLVFQTVWTSLIC